MKKILVLGTGLTGLVGSRVVELTKDTFQWQNASRSTGVDITDKKSVFSAIKKSASLYVIHFSAFTDLDKAEKQRNDKNDSCYQINVIGTKTIAEACAVFGKNLMYISTDAVFDGEKESPYIEIDQPNPIHWYGITKYLGELEVQNSGCKNTIVRIAYPFRARFEPKKDFVRKTIGRLKNGEGISMFDDMVFTPTFIDDIVPALKEILTKKSTGIFHVVGSTPLSPFVAAYQIAQVFELDEMLIKKKKLNEYIQSNSRAYPQYAALSNEKIKRELGISMRIFSEALEEMRDQEPF